MLSTTYPESPHLIFATNFSEACHAAIPMVAQWVDTLQARLTLLHVQPRGAQGQSARALDSFFAEAAHYPQSERRLLSGPTATGITEFCRQHPQAMLVMPPSVQTYLPRPLHVSLRAQVLRQMSTPMLTMLPDTRAIPEMPLAGGQVACWVTGDEVRLDHVREAAQLARQRDAELHLLHVLPEISEGLMLEALYSDRPLAEPAAVERLTDIAARLGDDLRVRVHIETGHPQKTLARLLRKSRANVLVADRDMVVRKRLMRGPFATALRGSPCVLICVPSRSDFDGQQTPPPNAPEDRRKEAPKPATAGLRQSLLQSVRSWTASDWPAGLVPA